MKRLSLFVALSILHLLLAACGSRSTISVDPPPVPGYLEGRVTIGPLQPVERVDVPTPVPPPEVFTSRSLNVFRAGGTTLVANVRFNPDGTYRVELIPGTYVVDIAHTGIDVAKGLPKTITIESGQTLRLDIDIDTGIR
jgi:hypothetical protein